MSQLNSITNYFFAKGPRKASEGSEKAQTAVQEDCQSLLLRAAAKRKNAEEEAVFRQRADCARTQQKRLCGADSTADGPDSGALDAVCVFFRRYVSEAPSSISACGAPSQSKAVSRPSSSLCCLTAHRCQPRHCRASASPRFLSVRPQ